MDFTWAVEIYWLEVPLRHISADTDLLENFLST